MVFDNFLNWIFAPITNNLSPLWAIVILSSIITLLFTLGYKFLTNQEVLKRLKQEQEELRKEMKTVKHDAEKYMEVQKRAAKKSFEHMGQSMNFKFLFFNMALVLLVLPWISKTFKGYGDIVSWGFYIPLFGTGLSWIGVYIIASIIFSIIIRKLLKVH